MIQNAQDRSVYTDFKGLHDLKTQANKGQLSEETLNTVAKQFESIFIQLMVKSMRDASQPLAGGGIFNSQQMSFYQDMFDKQISLNLAGHKLGLAEVLKQQLSKTIPSSTTEKLAQPHEKILPLSIQLMQSTKSNSPESDSKIEQQVGQQNLNKTDGSTFESKAEFVKTLWQEAKKASQMLGVNPAVLIAQAALETDWGRKVIQHHDGKSSFNLFNIKAGKNWDKETVAVKTLEYKNGIVGKERASFRSYDSFADSFEDYVNLLVGQDRYNKAIESASNPRKYLEALQSGGYATDPNYAKKILNIMESDAFKALFS